LFVTGSSDNLDILVWELNLALYLRLDSRLGGLRCILWHLIDLHSLLSLALCSSSSLLVVIVNSPCRHLLLLFLYHYLPASQWLSRLSVDDLSLLCLRFGSGCSGILINQNRRVQSLLSPVSTPDKVSVKVIRLYHLHISLAFNSIDSSSRLN
jgi:hypothetical protein